ncbi:MAG: cation:proton antiporter [Clostridia bacterium]|nr:cation:proton antiporter [Clostridia bacterium]
METYNFLLALALILLFTKLFGLLTAKVHLPQVVGALVAGILLGPSGAGLLHESDFLLKTAEIGVIMLMFIAGIDTDIKELKNTGPAACVIAMLGVLVPIIGCGGVYFLFFGNGMNFTSLLKSAFVGVVFAATSVSITVETLNEMGKLKTKVGSTLLSAAIIDDIIGIVVLSIISAMGDKSVNPGIVVLKIIGFFVFTFVVGFIVYHIFKRVTVNHEKSRRVAIWALAFCFVMSYCAEKFFGVADITGAYFAGVILCNLTKSRKYVAKKVTAASYLVFSPVFFAGIGLKTDLSGITGSIVLFSLVLIVMAVITKIIGCGAAAKICKMSGKDSLAVGVGMVARGEVALMVAQKGIDSGYIDAKILPAIVLCVIFAALITPILLKLVMSNKPTPPDNNSEESQTEAEPKTVTA